MHESTIDRIDPEHKEPWIARLRSGQDVQGKEMLKTMDGKLCCLGVYCEMVGLPTRVEPYPRESVMFVGFDGSKSNIAIPHTSGIPFVGELASCSTNKEFTGEESVFSCETRHLKVSKSVESPNMTDFRTQSYSLPTLNDGGFTFLQIADIIEYFL